jgi:hypothetical protein
MVSDSNVALMGVSSPEFQHVWSQVVGLDDQVLDDAIHRRIRVLDTRERNVMQALKHSGEDDLSHIFQEVGLEGRIAFLIISQIQKQLLNCVAESLVLSIFIELGAKELDLIENAVGVGSVLLAEKMIALVVKGVPLLVSSILEDEALLLETLANIGIDLLKPALQLRVLVSIAVDLVEGVEKVVGAGSVGETFDQGLKVRQCWATFLTKT